MRKLRRRQRQRRRKCRHKRKWDLWSILWSQPTRKVSVVMRNDSVGLGLVRTFHLGDLELEKGVPVMFNLYRFVSISFLSFFLFFSSFLLFFFSVIGVSPGSFD